MRARITPNTDTFQVEVRTSPGQFQCKICVKMENLCFSRNLLVTVNIVCIIGITETCLCKFATFQSGTEFWPRQSLKLSISGSRFYMNIDFAFLSIIIFLSLEKKTMFSPSQKAYFRGPNGLKLKIVS